MSAPGQQLRRTRKGNRAGTRRKIPNALKRIDEYLKQLPLSVGARTKPKKLTLEDVTERFGKVCVAVADFKHSASTLRTNSEALTVCENILSTESDSKSFEYFAAFRKFQPPGPTELALECTEELRKKLHTWAKEKASAEQMKSLIQNFVEEQRKRERDEKRTQEWNEWWGCQETERHRWNECLQRNKLQVERESDADECEMFTQRRKEVAQAAKRTREADEQKAWKREGERRENAKKQAQLKQDGMWAKETTELWEQWWMKIWEWEGGWAKRVAAIDTFLDTCKELFDELGEIDGSAAAHDFLAKAEARGKAQAQSGGGPRQLLEHHVTELRHAMDGDYERFWECSNSLFDLMIDKLLIGKNGLKMVVKKQDHFRNTFMDSATLAIFFSSITATTLQFSYLSADTTRAWTIVNLCWFASLVLSIASATNSFLGAIVHQSPETLRLSPRSDHTVLRLWFKFIPSTLLTISGLLFLIGICSFTHSSAGTNRSQGKAIQTVTLFLTSGNVFALLTMSLLAFTKVFRPSSGTHSVWATIFARNFSQSDPPDIEKKAGHVVP